MAADVRDPFAEPCLNLTECANASAYTPACNDTAFLLRALRTHGISKAVVFLVNSLVIAAILYRHLTQSVGAMRRIWANWGVLSVFYLLLSVASTLNTAVMWILLKQQHWCAFSVYFIAFVFYPLACYLLLMATERVLVLLHPTALAERSHKKLAALPVLLIMLYNVVILVMTKLREEEEDCLPHYEEVPVCVLCMLFLQRVWHLGSS